MHGGCEFHRHGCAIMCWLVCVHVVCTSAKVAGSRAIKDTAAMLEAIATAIEEKKKQEQDVKPKL